MRKTSPPSFSSSSSQTHITSSSLSFACWSGTASWARTSTFRRACGTSGKYSSWFILLNLIAGLISSATYVASCVHYTRQILEGHLVADAVFGVTIQKSNPFGLNTLKLVHVRPLYLAWNRFMLLPFYASSSHKPHVLARFPTSLYSLKPCLNGIMWAANPNTFPLLFSQVSVSNNMVGENENQCLFISARQHRSWIVMLTEPGVIHTTINWRGRKVSEKL